MQEDINKNICIFCSKDKRNSLGQDSRGDRRIKKQNFKQEINGKSPKTKFLTKIEYFDSPTPKLCRQNDIFKI